MRSRRELFAGDLALTARMLVAAVLTPAVVLAALVGVALVAPARLLFGLAIALAVGMWAMADERSRALAAGREVAVAEAPELHAIVERLCLLADLPKPRIVVEPEAQPNSWVVSVGRGRTSLHLTEGLLARLAPSQLEAVVAHELAHVANRDAMVMTVVGGPGAALLGGGTRVLRHGGIWFVSVGGLAAIALGWLGSIGTRALSRYREFAADAGAVSLTGNPAALASALMTVSEGLLALPERDLRAVASRDAFHLLPVSRGRNDGIPPLPPTHPSLQARIARLERLEARLQSAR
jgi:heat shock protein HtpX